MELTAMNARESFGIVLRTVGLLLVLYSIRIVAAVAAVWFAKPQNAGSAFGLAPGAFGAVPDLRTLLLGPVVTAVIALVAGAYLLRGAPGLLAYSYPEPR
ncbi:MAG TPA: hypothetical protein VK358_13500, partial [Longimicrobium sp.]|nr:hypothetical protein [Longimicrobium sp.]